MTRINFAKKLTASYLFVVAVTLLLAGAYLTRRLKHDFIAQLEQHLASQAQLMRYVVLPVLPKGPPGRIQSMVQELGREMGCRVTLIRADGVVMGDSERRIDELAAMENHLQRPEVQAALASGSGEAIRHSATLHQDMLYVAVPIERQGVLRVALPVTEVERRLSSFRKDLLKAGMAGLLVALLVALIMVRKINRPLQQLTGTARQIGQGDYKVPVMVHSPDEFGQLSRTLSDMAGRIDAKVQDLNQLAQLRREFVANVSHELKTPLTAIKGYVETLLEGALEDPAHNRAFLVTIEHHADHLNRLIEDLLDLSAIESKRIAYRLEPVVLTEVVERVLKGIAPLAKTRNVTLENQLSSDLPKVRADRERLNQVLVNLIDNAIKFNKNSGRVTVSGMAADGYLTVKVADTGPGIPEADLARVFERFFRVEKSRAQDVPGTGLGLSIVKHLVEAHQGTVSVQSAPGQGAVFTFTLPLA